MDTFTDYRELMFSFDEIKVYNQAWSRHCIMHIDAHCTLREASLYPFMFSCGWPGINNDTLPGVAPCIILTVKAVK